MNYSIIKKIILSFFVGLLCLISSFSSTVAENSNKSLTEIFKPYWPYEAFWAIPLIDQIKPRLALKTASDGRIIGRSIT